MHAKRAKERRGGMQWEARKEREKPLCCERSREAERGTGGERKTGGEGALGRRDRQGRRSGRGGKAEKEGGASVRTSGVLSEMRAPVAPERGRTGRACAACGADA